jgi:hypothetical protein
LGDDSPVRVRRWAWGDLTTMREQRALLRVAKQSRMPSRRCAPPFLGPAVCSKRAFSHRILSVAQCPLVRGSGRLTRVTSRYQAYYYRQRPACQLNSFIEWVKQRHGVYVRLPFRKGAKLDYILCSSTMDSRTTKHVVYRPESDPRIRNTCCLPNSESHCQLQAQRGTCAAQRDEARDMGS